MSVKYNLKYKLLGFLFGEIITARVLVLSTGKVIAMPLKELDDSEISDDLNPHEIKALHKKLYMHHNITTEYEMSDRNERSWYAYFSISLALAVIYILSTVSGVKPVQTLYTILCKCLFSEVTIQAVTKLDNKAAHCHT
ncbi:hypothetical protein SAMN03159353_10761, partial [Cedecea sp. NFIX57]